MTKRELREKVRQHMLPNGWNNAKISQTDQLIFVQFVCEIHNTKFCVKFHNAPKFTVLHKLEQ
ncbi:hypothetical protein BpHYR1_051657 [Brachionus plicatilis]|uniref:Uncharacterized protein n=1 Tax=Brachionus plicatilis TaxID=10195 RepID=A0A3M7Q0K5_BRAPC|nr:hypothetical protein BpHYR1_051657 [Brachionus plicatilis]